MFQLLTWVRYMFLNVSPRLFLINVSCCIYSVYTETGQLSSSPHPVTPGLIWDYS